MGSPSNAQTKDNGGGVPPPFAGRIISSSSFDQGSPRRMLAHKQDNMRVHERWDSPIASGAEKQASGDWRLRRKTSENSGRMASSPNVGTRGERPPLAG